MSVWRTARIVSAAAVGLIVVALSSQTSRTVSPRGVYDFTGDGRTDFSVATLGATGTPISWKILRNGAPTLMRIFDFGVVGDSFGPQNVIGALSKSEIRVWRAGNFYTTPFPDPGPGPLTVVQWGQPGDNVGRDGDYDGDGIVDDTIIRVVSGVLQWWMRLSSGGSRMVPFGLLQAGITTLAFQGADFNGDGRDEIVLAQVTSATGSVNWIIGDAVTGSIVLWVQFGNFNVDFVINPADYTGDGLADIAVWRGGSAGADAGAWFIRNTGTGGLVPPVFFGVPDPTFMNNDLPLRGDFDGDGRNDIAVWRRATGVWYWLNSTNGTLGAQQWGSSNDVPLPNFFVF